MHFTRKAAEKGSAVTVGDLRGWIDDPIRMELPTPLQNLVILAYALQDHQSFIDRGGPGRATLESLGDALVLKQQHLPPEAAWAEALRRAGLLFGYDGRDELTPVNVGRLADAVVERARRAKSDAGRYLAVLQGVVTAFDIGDDAPRLRTARSLNGLVERIGAGGAPDAVAASLAAGVLETSDAAVMRLLGRAGPLAAALERVSWPLFDGLRTLTDARRDEAQLVLDRLSAALIADEHTAPLEPALDQAARDAVRILTVQATPVVKPVVAAPVPPPSEIVVPRAPVPPAPAPAEAGPRRPRVVTSGDRRALPVADARRVLDEIAHALEQGGGRRLTLSWQIEEIDDK
jgi:hypothetical protein